MAQSLLILMLVTTQLLAGNSGTVYLCVSNDGSYCCIDTGSTSCECCHDEQEAAHDACCSDPACGDEAPPFRQQGLLAGDPCGCTHIPVLISADQPATVVRPSNRTESERLALLVAWLPSLFLGSQVGVLTSLPTRWSGPPAAPDFALTVISTVVLRC